MKRKIMASLLGLAAVAHAEDKVKFMIDDQRLQKIAEAHKLKNMSTDLLTAGIIVPVDGEGHYLIDLEKLKLAAQLADKAKDEEVISILQEIVGSDSKIMLVDGSAHEGSTQDFAVAGAAHLIEIEKLVNGLSKKDQIGK